MPIEHIVVDGSNIATEGRSQPSLKQLEEAVIELKRDHPTAEVTVIVDATFAHRIDPSELERFERAVLRGEYVHPPAGAIGRGDAFLLRVAEKVDGTVLSNDSFQEFHGEHPWLFERGRLLGGTPVPGVGWIFTPRQPVRGPRSHQAVRETEQAKKRVTKAIAVATREVVEPSARPVGSAAQPAGTGRRGAGESATPKQASAAPRDARTAPQALNDPLVFISFIAEHRLGERLTGQVEGYTSHGAVVRVGEMRCYIPLANLGDPPPRSAREVLKRHEQGEFVLTALDPHRRGAELALPGVAQVSGHPREETVAAEVRLAKSPRQRAAASPVKSRTKKAAEKAAKAPEKAASKKATVKKTAPAKAAPTKAAPKKLATSRARAGDGPAKSVAKKALAGKDSAAKVISKRSVAKTPEKVAASEKAPVKRAGSKKAAPAKKKAVSTRTPATKLAKTPKPLLVPPAPSVGGRRSPRTTARAR